MSASLTSAVSDFVVAAVAAGCSSAVADMVAAGTVVGIAAGAADTVVDRAAGTIVDTEGTVDTLPVAGIPVRIGSCTEGFDRLALLQQERQLLRRLLRLIQQEEKWVVDETW